MSAAVVAEPLTQEIRRYLKSPAGLPVEAPAAGSKPIGPYADFDACVAANADKTDPRAYCGYIQAAIEGKETPWMDERKWTGWTFETFIGSEDVVDLQKEMVPNGDYVANLPFLVKFGYFEWVHTGQKIGEIVAWRFKTNPKTGNPAPMIRVGLIDPSDPSVPPAMKGELAGARLAIEEMGKRGQTSINGMWAKREECDGKVCYKVTEHMALWAVGWVANRAANQAADVTNVSGRPSRKAMELSPGDARIALDLLERSAKMTFEECVAEASRRPDVEDPEALCGWLNYHGPNAPMHHRSADGKQAQDPSAVCGQLWFHGSDAQREAFAGGTQGRGPDERPPAEWWDDCVAHVEKSTVKGLEALVKGLPGRTRVKAEAMIAMRDGKAACPACKQFYDGLLRAGFKAADALAVLQEKVDRVTGWTSQSLKTPPKSMPNEGGSMSDEDDAKAKKAAEEAAMAAGGKDTPPGFEILMASIQELSKRLESIEMQVASTTPKMVDEAVKGVRADIAKLAEGDLKAIRAAQVKYDTRLQALESFAGRSAMGLGSKSFQAPPRDTGPKQGLSRKQLLELAAGSKNQSELARKMRDAAAGSGGGA